MPVALAMESAVAYLRDSLVAEHMEDVVDLMALFNLEQRQVGKLIKYLTIYSRSLRVTKGDPLEVYRALLNNGDAPAYGSLQAVPKVFNEEKSDEVPGQPEAPIG